jgi:hypothetical protein
MKRRSLLFSPPYLDPCTEPTTTKTQARYEQVPSPWILPSTLYILLFLR